MAHIKRFNELNENNTFFFSEWVDKYLLQDVIDHMKPGKGFTGDVFKEALEEVNNTYPTTNQSRLPVSFGKQVADWVDLYLVQDVLDRMNPALCDRSEEYNEELRKLVSE